MVEEGLIDKKTPFKDRTEPDRQVLHPISIQANFAGMAQDYRHLREPQWYGCFTAEHAERWQSPGKVILYCGNLS
jgi:hypothetical protein